MYEEPPPLPFPSLTSLKSTAIDILKSQRSPNTPDVEFKFCYPEQSGQTEKRRLKPNNKACDVCKKKKIRCDINALPHEPCTRANCQCEHHHQHFVSTEEASHSSEMMVTNTNSESIPSTTVFRKPGLLHSGHYTGETSFCGYLRAQNQPPVITKEDQYPTFSTLPLPPIAPNISSADQRYLIDVYYDNLNPFYPIINKTDMLEQLDLVQKKSSSYLSPLFFFALFARAAHVESNRQYTEDRQFTFHDLGIACLDYASALVHYYKDKPRISTVLALVIMTNHLEQEKKHRDLTKTWLWAGDAFRMALDLGIHRSFISKESDSFGQLCIRTFWLAYIADCTVSMTYGRPSATEEKVLDVTYPSKLPNDDDYATQWIDGLSSLISLSKVTARVIKFNYCPPPPFIIQGPVKRHNAFLVSVDSWLMDIISPVKEGEEPEEPESPLSQLPNTFKDESLISARITLQKKMFLYANLILLHRPYVNDVLTTRNTSNRPSYDICSYAAIIITDLASKLDPAELVYHSKSPLMAYALVMALRIHIMNATNANPEKYNAQKNFNLCLATLNRLPQAKDTSSMLYEALVDLVEQYNDRFLLAQEREDDIKLQQQLHQQMNLRQPVITAAQVVFSPGAIDKRKDRPNSDASNGVPLMSFNTSLDSSGSQPNRLVIKHHQHSADPNNRKKKKVKATHDSPAMTVESSKHKPKQPQQKPNKTFSEFQHMSSPQLSMQPPSSSNISRSNAKTPRQRQRQQQQQQAIQPVPFDAQLSSSTTSTSSFGQFSFSGQANPFIPTQYTNINKSNSHSSSSSSVSSTNTFSHSDNYYAAPLPNQGNNDLVNQPTNDIMQPYDFTPNMFPFGEDISFDEVLSKMNTYQNTFLSNLNPSSLINNGFVNDNFSTELMAMYHFTPQDSAIGISVSKGPNEMMIPSNDTNNSALDFP
ncbi:Nitrogen assimilation transcription factor nirA [Choanephora cucurbitarum]|uniref:Nitrogen assimilation transcription factor nirA n=1 Tax=Choanephora cucurbitarum TaxID=101091 RepID=A0A1C7NLG4_9FUNG|nr:Nitrogen assimilation transcription factor nirA [Choanephora cucurbitarum]